MRSPTLIWGNRSIRPTFAIWVPAIKSTILSQISGSLHSSGNRLSDDDRGVRDNLARFSGRIPIGLMKPMKWSFVTSMVTEFRPPILPCNESNGPCGNCSASHQAESEALRARARNAKPSLMRQCMARGDFSPRASLQRAHLYHLKKHHEPTPKTYRRSSNR